MPALNHWLQHNIRRVAAQGSIKVEISLQDYKDLFKSQDELTSSLLSGRHYGHHRAALVSDIISQDIGSPKITRLRIIVIVEGEIDTIMK
eukprot:3731446-Ditylum_brightwellii.AAC.1